MKTRKIMRNPREELLKLENLVWTHARKKCAVAMSTSARAWASAKLGRVVIFGVKLKPHFDRGIDLPVAYTVASILLWEYNSEIWVP